MQFDGVCIYYREEAHSLTVMRYIKLNYNDFELFDISWTEVNLNFYSTHKDAYRQMWKEQVRQMTDC